MMNRGEKPEVKGIGQPRSPFRKALEALTMIAGLLGLVWFGGTVGWPAIRANIALIGGWFFLLVALYLLAQMAFMAGWWVLLGTRARRLGYWRTFGLYLVGDSVNYFVPPANLSGEPVKAYLLSRSIGFSRSVMSIVVHKHAELVAQALFLCGGLSIAMAQFALPTRLRYAAVAPLVGLGLFVIVIFWALRRRVYGALLRGLMSCGIKNDRMKLPWHATASLDRSLSRFYNTRMALFWWATMFCLLGWCGGLLETYLVLQLLSTKAGLGTAAAVESVAMALNSMIFFVPGRIGSAEAVRIVAFSALGLPVAQGAVYGLIRRGRELAWTVPGLLILLKMRAGIGGAPREVPG